VHRALSSLDPQHRALANALETYKLVPACRACGLTRGLARKGLAYLRHHFTACGLADVTMVSLAELAAEQRRETPSDAEVRDAVFAGLTAGS